MPVTIFLIFLHVTALGRDFYTQPEGDKYQHGFATEAECKAAAKPLRRIVLPESISFAVTYHGPVCRPIVLEKSK